MSFHTSPRSSMVGPVAFLTNMMLLLTHPYKKLGTQRSTFSTLTSVADQLMEASSSSTSSEAKNNILFTLLQEHSPQELIQETIKTFHHDKGIQASIMNALLAQASSDNVVDHLLQGFEKEASIEPDLVSLSLAYIQTQREDYLQRARQRAKKLGGSARRKLLLAQKRARTPSETAHITVGHKPGHTIDILYENENVVIINKPSGVTCYHNKLNRNKRDVSLVDAMCKQFPLSTINPDALGIVHRLDRGTSGCMVLAKTDPEHAALVVDFFNRQNQKDYTCLVEGIPEQSTGTVSLSIQGRNARSDYVVEDVIGVAALLRVRTWSGRKHQVRIHCAQGLGCPIVGDTVYGNKHSTVSDGRFLLHASSLLLPRLGVSVQAPVPDWWQPIMDSYRQ